MVKQTYVPKRFGAEHRQVIDQANAIIREYSDQGFVLTIRQLYYQFVSRDFIPNNMRSYKRLGGIINDARLAGEVDWDAIEDRTRNLNAPSHWPSPGAIIATASRSYAIDKWEGQEWRPEVWVEKDALLGVIEGVCRRNDVAHFSCRGYTSQSEMRAAGERFRRMYENDDQQVCLIHLGDHDPSGIDMSRDIRERLEMFAGRPIRVERIALNMDQIQQYNPPPNPAKSTDSRYEGYSEAHGEESWELDALEPRVMADLIESTILSVRDHDMWERRVDREARGRRRLVTLAEQEQGGDDDDDEDADD